MDATYETLIIFDPTDKALDTNINKFKDMCQEFSKKYKRKIKFDRLGEKKLAYKLKDKYETGYYVQIFWQGTNEDVADLERHLRIDDDVLKFMTVKNLEDVELEELTEDDVTTTEQDKPDALDVLLGLAHY